jgi:hypothetical protein
MSPDQDTTTAQSFTMPGVHDFRISIPFTRRFGEGEQTMTMLVRLPAANATAARQLGAHIAVATANANAAATELAGDIWRPLTDEIAVTDVDDSPSIDDVAAERDHWRKVVTALAGKVPAMMAQVSADEYTSADFSQLVIVPVDATTMLFTTEAAMSAVMNPAGSTMEPAPAETVLPEPYGGHADPDVRQVDAAALTAFPPKAVEIIHDGQWTAVAGTNVTRDMSIEVVLLPPEQEFKVVTFDDLTELVIIRPGTVEAIAADLPAAATHGRQVLTATGWWTLAQADYQGSFSDTYKVLMVKNPEEFDPLGKPINYAQPLIEKISTSYAGLDQVLLRDRPGSWWV